MSGPVRGVPETERIREIREKVALARAKQPGSLIVADFDYLLEALAALEQRLEKADCGGINCGDCQQCLTVNYHFARQAIDSLERRLAQTEAALWVIADGTFDRPLTPAGIAREALRAEPATPEPARDEA